MNQTNFTAAQKRSLFKDGYVVVPKAIPIHIGQRAREVITAALPKKERRLLIPAEIATHEAVLSLFNDTCLAQIIRQEMGPFPPIISSQVAVTPAQDRLGGEPGPHVDGSWSGDIPGRAEQIDAVTGRPLDAERYFGKNDDIRGTNDGQLWIDPAKKIALGSYTTLVGVALNDQSQPGKGQLGVLRGMHEEVQSAFQRQRDANGQMGPEGLDWPRIKTTQKGGTYLNGLPDTVRQQARDAASTLPEIEGWPWRSLTPILLNQGDAVILLHACPHTATPNLSDDPRMSVYFRIRRQRPANPHEGARRLGHGVSDHPDRGYFGQFLDYPDDYDPWQTSIDKLCDHWSEWDGMQETVASHAP